MLGYKAYAGVGSRETPTDVLEVMTRFARHMEAHGYILRSGGAAGADQAFEAGVTNAKMREIYLPYPGFMRQTRPNRTGDSLRPGEAAMDMGELFHPRLAALPRTWQQDYRQRMNDEKDGMKQALLEKEFRKLMTLRSMMGRNCHQILGANLIVPAKFTICWTQDAADGVKILTSGKSGGTGQAIRVSAHHGVTVFNLKNPETMEMVLHKIRNTP